MNGHFSPLGGYYELFRDGGDAVAFARHENESFPGHFHRSLEIHYTLYGELTGTLDGWEHSLPAGWVQISSPYMIHSFHTPKESQTLVIIIPLSVVPSLEKTLSEKVFAAPVLKDDEDKTFLRLIRLLEESDPDNTALRKGVCYTLLGLFIARCGLRDAPADRHSDFIRRTLEYLEANYTLPLRVEDVAARFGYSRSRFSRLFSNHVGCPLPQYLSMLRCRHAAQLLKMSDLKVSEVALQSGFESLRTFYRTFQEVFGVTPRQYREG